MTYLVTVDGQLASEVTIPDCSRPPRVGERCRVKLGDNVIDFGKVLSSEPIQEASV